MAGEAPVSGDQDCGMNLWLAPVHRRGLWVSQRRGRAVWSARQSHKLEAAGSNPAFPIRFPATSGSPEIFNEPAVLKEAQPDIVVGPGGMDRRNSIHLRSSSGSVNAEQVSSPVWFASNISRTRP